MFILLGNGLELNNNNEFSVKTNTAEDNKFIALDANGFGLSGITNAIDSKVSGKLNIETFELVSGNYKSADVAVSGLIMTEVNEKLDKTMFEDLSGNYKDADIALSGLLSAYTDNQLTNLQYAQIIKLDNYEADEYGIAKYLQDNNLTILDKTTLFIDYQNQCGVVFENTSTIISISQEYISKIEDIIPENAEKLLNINAITGYVENKLQNVQDNLDAYKTADVELSGLIMDEVDKKAEIIYGELPETINSGKLYINDSGSVSTVINNSLKTISYELVDNIFTNIDNNDVIPTTEAVATFVNIKLNESRIY